MGICGPLILTALVCWLFTAIGGKGKKHGCNGDCAHCQDGQKDRR